MTRPNYDSYNEYHYWAWVLTPAQGIREYLWDKVYPHKVRLWETWQANLFNNEEDR